MVTLEHSCFFLLSVFCYLFETGSEIALQRYRRGWQENWEAGQIRCNVTL